jgi:uncharacterized protein (DUF58 family)
MLPDRKELLRKARRIEIKSRKLVSMAMAGEYQSVFRGTGVEFDSVREYVFGDDVRSIDWNVTARSGKPYVKRFVESRERSVILALDCSASLEFGSDGRTKAELAAEFCAVLALAAHRNRDQVGLLLFSDRVELFLPPGRGAGWPHRLLRQLLGHEPMGRGTDLNAALLELDRHLRRPSVIFLVSDFLDPIPTERLARLRRRHDLVAICVGDPREERLRGSGLVHCEDPESGERFLLDAGSGFERAQFERAARLRREERGGAFRRASVEQLELRTDGDLLPPLLRFFERRERRER